MPIKAMTDRQRNPIRREPWVKKAGQRNGSTRRWREFRLWQLKHHPICVFGEHAATAVDHIKPLAQGGAEFDPYNVRSVCDDCHKMLTDNFRLTGRNQMPNK